MRYDIVIARKATPDVAIRFEIYLLEVFRL